MLSKLTALLQIKAVRIGLITAVASLLGISLGAEVTASIDNLIQVVTLASQATTP